MLASLKLTHLLLVEACEVHFDTGFTIISGETGSGKTVFTQAIALALGDKADPSLIRQGEERAIIEVTFDLESDHPLFQLLEEAGVTCSPDELLIIRREIVKTGKSRAFINSQMVALSLLHKIKDQLIDMVGQHSHSRLRDADYQRAAVDLFGGLSPLVSEYSKALQFEKKTEQELAILVCESAQRTKELERLQMQFQEMKSLQLEPDEETTLTIEHSRLAHYHQLFEKGGHIQEALSTFLPQLSRVRALAESLSTLDITLKEPEELIKQAMIALQEGARTFSHYISRLENDPERFHYLEERLALIHRLSQKYGRLPSDLHTLQDELQAQIHTIQQREQDVDALALALKDAQNITTSLARKLTEARTMAAEQFQQALTVALRRLNMAECELSIEMGKQERTLSGEDAITFWMRANKGEPSCRVKESASGGELSRLMLAIKRVLAEKNDTPILIFDEIDSNVGGETAALIGEELRALGQWRQIFCITHFPQVAACGDHHMRVEKHEKEGRTIATLEKLNAHTKEKEILRMLGGKKYASIS